MGKVLIVTGVYPPSIGGPATFIPKLSNYLSDNGHDVVVITLSDYTDIKKGKYTLITIDRNTCFIRRFVSMVSKVALYAKDANFILSNTSDLEAAIGSALRLKRVDIVKVVGDLAWERYTLRNPEFISLDLFQLKFHGLKVTFERLYRNFPLIFAKKIIVPSCYMKGIVSSWSRMLSSKVHVVYNGVDSPLFDTNLVSEKNCEFDIIIVCRLVPHKSVHTIMKALDCYKNKLRIVIVGDGPERSKLMRVAESSKHDYHFTGQISKELVYDYLLRSKIFILNSSYEGLPHVVVEAMLAGCVVLASSVGGTPEVVANGINGLLFEYDDETQIFNAVSDVINNSSLQSSLRINANITARKEFNASTMLLEYNRIINEKVICN